jgi:hypothetical protein
MYGEPSTAFRVAVSFVFVMLGTAVAVYGALKNQWVLTVLGGGGAFGFVVMGVILLLGKDPWWMRPLLYSVPADETTAIHERAELEAATRFRSDRWKAVSAPRLISAPLRVCL